MRLSKKFLNDYIDINNIKFDELADKMVNAGNEYESIEKMCNATNLIIGEVVECVDHKESDHLHVCQVNIGESIKQIVCGAPNVKAGIKVIVAQVGSTLPGGIVIKEALLAGVESNGMICSKEELGLDSKYLKEEDKIGIHILGSDAIVGEDPLKYLNYDDEVIDFELTSNRADLLSILGLAYEVGAIYDLEVKEPKFELIEEKENINDIYSLEVNTDNCSIYLGRLVKNVTISESPEFIKARLIASGIRPINNVVDISNYVMLEYGQPLHFFDADKLGNKVIVRNASNGELITTLDGNVRSLEQEDIVISTSTEAVALAGVMGGLSTEVETTTKNIFIESAIFDSLSIRKTSKKILKSEASSRYEKGIDPNRTLNAINRASYLLSKYANGSIDSGVLEYNKAATEDKIIDISLEKINSVLGLNLKLEEVTNTFRRLGFLYNTENNNIKVDLPTRRLDINIKEDLIEEVGRIIGYDKVVGKLPVLPIKSGKLSNKAIFKKNIENRLSNMLYQTVTYSLTTIENNKMFIDKEYKNVEILSPMSEDKKVMRTSLIPSLLNVFDYNNSRNIKDINIYEIGSVYYTLNDLYVEESRVSGLLFGNNMNNNWQKNIVKNDFYVLKGIVENILDYIGLNGRYAFDSKVTLKDLHPGKSCSILVDNEIVGYMGAVHPLVNKKDIYVFELSIDKLYSKKVRLLKFKEISKYPSVNKDVAFIVDKTIESEEIKKALKKVGGRLLSSIEVFDLYIGENVDSNSKSLAFSLSFQDQSKTLTDEEVTELFNKMILEVETKLGAKLRNK